MLHHKSIDISIITITYKDPSGLAKTIDSLKKITSSAIHWEHVIVDGSPSDNVQVLDSIPAGWPLVYCPQEPKGIYHAMNEGLKASKGEVLWFLNGGDWLIDSLALASIVSSMANDSGIDLGFSGQSYFRNGIFLYPVLPPKNLVFDILRLKWIPHQAVFYRRGVFTRIGPFDDQYKIVGDYEHFFRCALAGLNTQRFMMNVSGCDMDGVSSNWRAVFSEVKMVRHKLATRMPFTWNILNGAFFYFEREKTRLLKSLRGNVVAESLRPIWIQMKRFNARTIFRSKIE
jgi:glycosyltransferase involved in cell wall biosynthesis